MQALEDQYLESLCCMSNLRELSLSGSSGVRLSADYNGITGAGLMSLKRLATLRVTSKICLLDSGKTHSPKPNPSAIV